MFPHDTWYDRSGRPIDMATADGLLGDRAYSRIGLTEVTSTSDHDVHRVSTVWLGLDHQLDDGPPLIFETMVFTNGAWDERLCRRYATEAEALAGHAETVTLVAATTPDEHIRDLNERPPA